MTQFDRNQAEAFLKVIDPEAAGFTFQTFDDARYSPPTLDKEVEALRPKGETKAGHGRALNISDPEPWADAVDAAEFSTRSRG